MKKPGRGAPEGTPRRGQVDQGSVVTLSTLLKL